MYICFMEEKQVTLYDPKKKKNIKVLIEAYINKNGDLVFGEYDFSSSSSEYFGSDIEIDLVIKKTEKEKFIKIIQRSSKKVTNDISLLKWLEKKYSKLSALYNIERLLKINKISYTRTRWP